MEQTSVVDLLALVLAVSTWLIDFIKAILIPVIPAGVIIAFLVDHVLKRLSFWKDGWAGKASVVLNLVFSAGLYFASQGGKSEAYLAVITQLTTLLTLIVSVGIGFAVANKTHQAALASGIGKSITEEEDKKFWEDLEDEDYDSESSVGEVKYAESSVGEVKDVRDGPVA
jgi:hypothetical protein